MKIEYPKLIYRSENRTCCTVLNIQQHDCLKGYFCDPLDHSLLPYNEIDIVEAMRIFAEAKKESDEEEPELEDDGTKPVNPEDEAKKESDIKVSDSEVINHEPEPVSNDPGFPGMTFKPKIMGTLTWHELRGYGKKVERTFGVELPLKAKRDIVEQSIQEVLDGNDSKRRSQTGV